jgi:hypothetical protein
MNFLESGVPNLRFSVMGAELVFSCCTQTSASFRFKAGLRYGWIDVHFPCEGHIKARILAALPDEFLEVSKIREIVPKILNRLEISGIGLPDLNATGAGSHTVCEGHAQNPRTI